MGPRAACGRHAARATRWAGLALGLGLLPAAAARAGTPEGPGTLEVRLGLGAQSVREELLVPLAFTGPLVEPRVRYTRLLGGGRARLEGEVRLGAGVLFDRHGNRAVHARHELGVGALAGRSEGWSLGGVARLASDLSYVASWDDAHGYWLSSATLGPAVRYQHTLGAGRVLVARMEGAVAGLAARPPLQRRNKQDALTHLGFYFDRIGGAQAVGPGALQQVRGELTLRQGRWEAGVEARYGRAAGPGPHTTLFTGVFLGWRAGG